MNLTKSHDCPEQESVIKVLINTDELLSHAELREILVHPVFESLRNFPHHGKISCYDHSITVACLAYRMAGRFGCDRISAAKGGLLHDLYLYDWHSGGPGLHGFRHPSISLQNSLRFFTLNEIERDAILRHMWPLTPVPPRYRESLIVSIADKRATLRDFITNVRTGGIFSRDPAV